MSATSWRVGGKCRCIFKSMYFNDVYFRKGEKKSVKSLSLCYLTMLYEVPLIGTKYITKKEIKISSIKYIC